MDKSFLTNIKEKKLVDAEKQFKESIKAKISEKLADVKAKVTKQMNESLEEVNRYGISNPGLDALAAKKKKEAEAKKKKLKEEDITEDNLLEETPPGMEDWVKANKERFKKQYGAKKGLEVLYATAWRMHDEKK